MKKFLILSLLCVFTTASAQRYEIEEGWRSVNIKLKVNNNPPTVIDFLKQFNQAWHTDAADALLAEAGDRRYVSNDVEEGGSGHVFVDCDDFCCASYDTGEMKVIRLDARTYKKSNDHIIFAVAIQPNTLMATGVCCFYDYNPNSHMMMPINPPDQGFKKKWTYSHIAYDLGHGYDQTFMLTETSEEGTVYHHFPFNGNGHKFAFTSDTGYDDEEDGPDDESEGVAPYQQITIPIAQLPESAVLHEEWNGKAVYVDAESLDSDYQTVWLTDKKAGTATRVCYTNPTAEPQWEKMEGTTANGVEVPLHLIAIAKRAFIAPGDGSKVLVEGCPDGRNIWTYIVDTKNHTAIQLPTSEGVVKIDRDKNEITLSAYGYDTEGRYSFQKVFDSNGKFLRRIAGRDRP